MAAEVLRTESGIRTKLGNDWNFVNKYCKNIAVGGAMSRPRGTAAKDRKQPRRPERAAAALFRHAAVTTPSHVAACRNRAPLVPAYMPAPAPRGGKAATISTRRVSEDRWTCCELRRRGANRSTPPRSRVGFQSPGSTHRRPERAAAALFRHWGGDDPVSRRRLPEPRSACSGLRAGAGWGLSRVSPHPRAEGCRRTSRNLCYQTLARYYPHGYPGLEILPEF